MDIFRDQTTLNYMQCYIHSLITELSYNLALMLQDSTFSGRTIWENWGEAVVDEWFGHLVTGRVYREMLDHPDHQLFYLLQEKVPRGTILSIEILEPMNHQDNKQNRFLGAPSWRYITEHRQNIIHKNSETSLIYD